jgi:hypothetical protein
MIVYDTHKTDPVSLQADISQITFKSVLIAANFRRHWDSFTSAAV